MRILMAEDEPDLLEITIKRLRAEGFGVDGCADGEEASLCLDSAPYDLAILDIMMPKKDGLAVLRDLRAKGSPLPVLMLTARDAVIDRVAGLNAGADDYLTKPYAFDELLARVLALLRRGSPEKTNILTAADLTMDLSVRRVTRAGREIDLSAREFAILEYLLRNKGRVLSRRQLEDHVWDYQLEVGSNIVDVYVRYLRRKIDEPFETKLIRTVRGVGYAVREDG